MTNTREQRTKNRETLKKITHTNAKTQRQHKQQQSNTEITKGTTHNTSQNPTTEPASRNNNAQDAEIDDLTKVAKHPPDQPTTAAKHPLEANFNQCDGGGKASTRPER